MEIPGERSVFLSYRCEDNCPEITNFTSIESDFGPSCDHVCYHDCHISCVKDYDPLFQFEIRIEGILFSVCNVISLVCLLVSFLTFCVFSKLRTVSGKAAMNLILALFMAKLSFQVNPSFTKLSSHWCSILAMAQHYFCLVAFHWASVLAYDLYVTVKQGRRDVRNKGEHPRFLSYFLFCWGFPWSAVIACITVESLQKFGFHYGNHEHCGVFGDEVLLYSLAIPLVVISMVNICLFILIACHPGLRKNVSIEKAKKYSLKNNKYLQQIKSAFSKRAVLVEEPAANTESGHTRPGRNTHNSSDTPMSRTSDVQSRNMYQDETVNSELPEISLLKIYINISSLMALSWLSGFTAAFSHIYELWILFIIFNCLQGICVLKSFVLRRDVRLMWKRELTQLRGRGDDVGDNGRHDEASLRRKFLRRNLPKRIAGQWPSVSTGKLDIQPLYSSHLDI